MNHERDNPPGRELLGQLERDGFALVPEAFSAEAMLTLGRKLDPVMSGAGASVLAVKSNIYAARNLVELWAEALDWAFHPNIKGLVEALLGKGFGMVRGIFFDKNPETSWGLPWHQDVSIAIKAHHPESQVMLYPTIKRGVPHVEAPGELLARMATVRIHLDPADESNGALEVIPKSHLSGKVRPPGISKERSGKLVACNAGDVLLMRPLLWHRSAKPGGENDRHRRILHFEFAPAGPLPEGFEWNEFHTGGRHAAKDDLHSYSY